MFYTYKNLPITLNNARILCDSLSLSTNANIRAEYQQGERNSYYFSPSDGIRGGLNIQYYITGNDLIKNFIDNEVNILSGNIGGFYFNSGYLNNYRVDLTPNQDIKANVEIVFFEELKGSFCASFVLNTINYTPLNVSDVVVSNLNTGSLGIIDNLISANYNYSAEITPVYTINRFVPEQIKFGAKKTSMTLTCDKMASDLPIYGKRAGVNINLYANHAKTGSIVETFGCSGKLDSKSIDTRVGELILSTINITNEIIGQAPTITSVSTGTAIWNGWIIISGTNLINTTKLKFSSWLDNGGYAAFKVINQFSISGLVPTDAISGPITLYNYYDQVEWPFIGINALEPSL